MSAWFSIVAALSTLGLASAAPTAVTVLSTDQAPASGSFVASMRIQLTNMASVQVGPVLVGRSRREQVRQAHQHLMTSGASIAVWEERRLDAVTAQLQVVVLAVTRESSDKPIEVARVLTSGAPEDDRLLALKVGELLFQVLSSAKSEKDLAAALRSRGVALAAPPSKAPALKPGPKTPAASNAPKWRAFAEAGGGLRVDSRFVSPAVGGKLALGSGYYRAPWRVEVAFAARRLTDQQVRADNGWLNLREVNVGAAVRGLWHAGPLSVGGSAAITADFLSAAAVALDGRRGMANKVGASWALGPEGPLQLAPQWEMRAFIALETTWYEQRFAIEATPVAARKRSHLASELSLLFWIP